MADYCTLAQVRTYKGIGATETDDDSLIEQFIDEASTRIDTYCKRTFAVRTGETRKFDAVQDVRGRVLYMDDDLQAVTEIVNGDGDTLDSSDYVTLPTNRTPKYAIKLKTSSGTAWTWQTDPEEAISVTGSWGYNNTPNDIRHAAIRLAAWYYDQRDAPFGTQAMPELGVIEVTPDIPSDVQALLDPYVRESVG